jgi:hypothetical protein
MKRDPRPVQHSISDQLMETSATQLIDTTFIGEILLLEQTKTQWPFQHPFNM